MSVVWGVVPGRRKFNLEIDRLSVGVEVALGVRPGLPEIRPRREVGTGVVSRSGVLGALGVLLKSLLQGDLGWLTVVSIGLAVESHGGSLDMRSFRGLDIRELVGYALSVEERNHDC